MPATDQARPTNTPTDQARPTKGKEGRFGIGTFGTARFGKTDPFDDQPRPTQNFTDQARPS